MSKSAATTMPGAISSVLNQMLGVFERRQLISAFIPVLFFTTSTTLVALLAIGGHGVSKWWSTASGGDVALLATLYVMVVFFLTFVALGLQDAIERAFQGSWPTFWPFTTIASWMVRRQERAHDGVRRCYEDARSVQKYLKKLEVAVRDLDSAPPTSVESDYRYPMTSWALLRGELERLETAIGGIEKVLKDTDIPFIETVNGEDSAFFEVLKDLGKQIDLTYEAAGVAIAASEPERNEVDRPADAIFQCGPVSSVLTYRLAIGRCSQKIEDATAVWNKRVSRYREYYLFGSPTRRGSVGPTILSNIFRSMEEHPYRLYGIDAASVWSRLQPLASNRTLNPLRDAKASMDQMLLMSTLTLASGFIIGPIVSACVADISSRTDLLAMGFSFSILAFASLLAPRFRRYREFRLASRIGATGRTAVEYIVPASVLLVALTSAVVLGLGAFFGVGNVLILRLGLGTSICAAGAVFMYVFYWNSLFAAAGYSEKVSATFDLYRWRVLKSMNFSLPQNLREEWKTWEHFRDLMFSDEFDARHFMFHPRTIAAEGDMRRVLVPKETIARRTKVDDGDLRLAYIPATLLPQNAVTSPGDICNHITMTTLSRGQGISINLLCEEGNADSMLEVVVQTKNDSSLAGWMVQEGDQVLLGGPMGERPIFGGPRRATVTGTVCQVYPYRDEDRRLYGRRYVGETEFPIAVVLDRRELTEIGLKPEDLVFIGRC